MTDATSPTFERDIKPLFRGSDPDAMIAAFELWSFDDVKANADASFGQSARARCPAVSKHLAAAMVAREALTGLLGFGLRVVRGDDLAVLLLDVPALTASRSASPRRSRAAWRGRSARSRRCSPTPGPRRSSSCPRSALGPRAVPDA